MPIYRAQISVATDTALPRDQMVITPHFNVSGAAPTPTALATKLCDDLGTWLTTAPPIRTKIYLATGAGPHFPLADVTKTPAGAALTSSFPREIALCLSYYETLNQPGKRGRLWIPFSWIYKAGGSTTQPGIRPVSGHMAQVLSLASSVLKSQSASGASWGFWSSTSSTFRTVTNYYCDDEWDTMRKRGLKSTTRQTGTAP